MLHIKHPQYPMMGHLPNTYKKRSLEALQLSIWLDSWPCEPPDSRWHKIWASSCVRLHLAWSKQIAKDNLRPQQVMAICFSLQKKNGNNMNIPSRERNITKFSLESTGQVDTKGKLMFHPKNFVQETHFLHLSRKKCARSTDEVPLYRPRLGTTIPRIAGKFTATSLYLI